MPESNKSEWIGKTIGKYHIQDKTGVGGMALVFKAYQANLDRYVALKLIREDLLAETEKKAELLERFTREARFIAGLHHPNIVQIHDYDVEGDLPYIVMEWIGGPSLKDFLSELHSRGQWVSTAEAVRVVAAVGQALAYAHEHNLIHRDVKPANVMLEGPDLNSRIILTDFGIAKLMASPSQTATNTIIGTPAYMAPEQGRGLPGDHRADIYSLGVMLYELLTGQLPYTADTPISVMIKHMTEPLPAPRSIKPDLPEPLERVVLRTMEKQADDRFQSIADTLIHLEAAVREVTEVPTAGFTGDVSNWLSAAKTVPTPVAPTLPAEPPTPPAQEVTPPPQPALPPRLHQWVGREAELLALADTVAQRHWVFLSGMPGVGKTTLAAALAERLDHPQKTFWHAFHTGETVSALLWRLAGFLHWHHQPAMWNALQRAQEAGNAPPPPEVLFDYLVQAMYEQDYVLGLDDFHWVENDPLLSQLLERLLDLIHAGEITVIVTSRHAPPPEMAEDVQPLSGLSRADGQLLAQSRGLALSDSLVDALLRRTEGNPQLLTLALDTLRRTKDPARLINRLGESEQIERFLMKEVDDGLAADERAVMSGVAVLGRAASRDAIAATLDGHNVRRTLNDLANRHLLIVTDGEIGKEYSQVSLLREFYYGGLEKHEQQAMHLRAAEYYADEDALRAAQHFAQAGQDERAAHLIVGEVRPYLHRGESHAVQAILGPLTARNLPPALWVAVLIARGQVAEFLGDIADGRKHYTAAEAALAALPASSETRDLRVQVCQGMGELLQIDYPTEAMEWLRRGLEPIDGEHHDYEAALRIRLGRVLAFVGQNAEAEVELERGQALLPSEPSRLHATALGNLANLYCNRGEVERGLGYYHQVEALAQQLNDRWLLVEVWLNLGIECDIAGRWGEALLYYRQAAEEAERVGGIRQTMRAYTGLGNTLLKEGNLPGAEEHLQRALRLARDKRWDSEAVYTLISLGGLCVRRKEVARAEEFLAEAEQLAQRHEVREPLPELYAQRAALRLLQNQNEQALADAEKALTLAREQNARVYEGMALRMLAQAQLANGEPAAARANLELSLALLTALDAYEAAQTKKLLTTNA